jgi:predicted permease
VLGRILGIFLPVLAVALVGYLYARRMKPDMAWVNRISMDILAPALVFSALASKSFDVGRSQPLILGSVGVVLGSGLLAWPVARLFHTSARTFVPTSMFNNCGNMGLPLAVLTFGEAGFPAMVALFSISNLLQFTVGMWIVDHRARVGRLLASPIVLATIAGFAFAVLHPPLPTWLGTSISMVGDALVPMMLLSLGVRLAEVQWSDWRIGVIGGIACPVTGMIMAAILAPVLGLDARQAGLLMLFGCLPPAVLNFMVAEQFRQEPAKVASIVLIGNLLSIVFVPIGLTLALHHPAG